MNIHLIVITGSMTAPLAIELKKMGHRVTGSDQDKTFPPFSDLLKQNHIPVNSTPITQDIDLVIVGSGFKHFQRTNDEFALVQKLKIPYISATEYLAQNLVKENSIIVAGSYGKTTTTAILAHVMPEANYFFGGQAVNNTPSLHFSDSPWSIVEGDESINGLDTQAKFLYYPTKYVILTSALWEHKDSYPTEADNFLAYQQLVTRIPQDGALIYNPRDPSISPLLSFCRAPAIPYASKNFTTSLIGPHNQENLAAAYTLCQHLKIDFDISQFPGIRRRLEIVAHKNDILVIDDFAQSAERVLAAVSAVNSTYPHRRLFVYFEPHASFLQHPPSLIGFSRLSPYIHQFVLGKIKFTTSQTDRVTAQHWRQELGDQLIYLPLESDIINHFHQQLAPQDILLHFSSGGLSGLNTLKTIYNKL